MTEIRVSNSNPQSYDPGSLPDAETAANPLPTSSEVNTCSDAPGTEATRAADADSGTSKLLSKYGRPLPSFVSQANNHAERTVETPAQVFKASTGVNATATAAYVEAAVLQGAAQGAPISVDVLSLSAQAGKANEVSATLLHLGAGESRVQGSVDVIKAEAHGGIYNPDGSTGVNLGASVTVVGMEVQLCDGANSLNGGLSLGVGLEASLGLRDADEDNVAEFCARVAVGPVALGACFEPGGWFDTMR